MHIREDPLDGIEILAFLRDHLKEMHAITPPGKVHALAADAMLSPDITVYSAWEENALVGCGALRALAADLGEIKSMRTAPGRRGEGIGSRLLIHLIAEARDRGYAWLKLETGSGTAFQETRAFYRRHGFRSCGASPPSTAGGSTSRR